MQARSQVLKFGGAKYIFRGHDFCFYHIFKTNFLGTRKFWGNKRNFGGYWPRMPPRGYRPAGMYNLLLLPAASLLFIRSTAANEFELYLWDTAKCQPTQNTFKHKLRIHSIILCDITIHIVTHRVHWFSCLAFVLLQYAPARPPNLKF